MSPNEALDLIAAVEERTLLAAAVSAPQPPKWWLVGNAIEPVLEAVPEPTEEIARAIEWRRRFRRGTEPLPFPPGFDDGLQRLAIDEFAKTQDEIDKRNAHEKARAEYLTILAWRRRYASDILAELRS